MKTVAVVQARMGSTRLPGKVLASIAGQPMLVWVVSRTARARLVDEVVVATSVASADDPIEAVCSERGYPFVRGSADDVLSRVYGVAVKHAADVVVRITGDCPLIDPELIDHVVATLTDEDLEFCANRLPPPWKRTYPIGLDVEACTFPALKRAWAEAKRSYEREHVMPYFYEQAGRFKIRVLEHHEDLGRFRLTVDTPADLELIRRIVGRMDPEHTWGWRRVVALLQNDAALRAVNADVCAKSVYQA